MRFWIFHRKGAIQIINVIVIAIVNQNQPGATYGSLNSKGTHPSPGICLFLGKAANA